MKWFLYSQIVLIGVCFTSACAFKDSHSHTDDPIVSPSPTQSPSPVPKKRGFVSISGSKEKGVPFGEFKREFEANLIDSAIHITSPMSLPEKVPSEFALKIASSSWKGKTLGKVIVKSRLTLDNGVGTELIVSDLNTVSDAENQAVAWTMNIGGLDKLMPPQEENTQYIQVELYEKGKGDAAETVTFPVMTPPSKLGASQMTVSAYESSKTAALAEFKTILSTNFRLDLIQVIQLTNGSTLPVFIREPVKISGNLNSKFRRITLNQRMCGYDAPVQEWVDELATDFFLLPLTKEVSDDPVTFINKKLKVSFWEQRLEPGEEKLIGIYAQGTGAANLASGNYPMQKMQPTQVVSDCKSRCHNPKQRFFAEYWHARNWPGGSKACVEPELCMLTVGSWTPRINERLCNQCMEWDLSENNAWRDIRSSAVDESFYKTFCLGNEPGRFGWKVEKFHETIKIGTENDDVILRLPVQSSLVRVRYDLQVPNEVSQERTISGLIQQVSIQQK